MNISENIKAIGIDNSKQMIKEAKKNSLNKGCIFKSGDITEFKFNKANLITSFYTIQFIHPSIRVELIKNIQHYKEVIPKITEKQKLFFSINNGD